MLTPTYMDYSATTPVDKRVAEKMAKYLTMEVILVTLRLVHIIMAGRLKKLLMKLVLRWQNW